MHWIVVRDNQPNLLTRMSGFFQALVVSATVCLMSVAASEDIRQSDGNCWSNGTHYGDGRVDVIRLPPCWLAFCNNERKTVTVGNRCGAGLDIMYGKEELKSLLWRLCYPSAKSELPGDQCCGGYPICALHGENRKYFNTTYFMMVLSELSPYAHQKLVYGIYTRK